MFGWAFIDNLSTRSTFVRKTQIRLTTIFAAPFFAAQRLRFNRLRVGATSLHYTPTLPAKNV